MKCKIRLILLTVLTALCLLGCNGAGGGGSNDSINLHVTIAGQGVIVEETERPFVSGDRVTLEVVPNPGWEFAGWEGAVLAELGDNRYQIRLERETYLTALFTSEYPYHFVAYGPNLSSSPYDLAADGQGRLYATVPGNDQIAVIAGDQVSYWGESGDGPGKLSSPTAIAVGPSGDIYVAQYQQLRIQKFTAAGEFLEEWRADIELGERESWDPRGLGVDADGAIYIAEFNLFSFRSRIQVWHPTEGLTAEWFEPGDKQADLPIIRALHVADGRVYLIGSDRLQVYATDGTFLWEQAGQGDAAGAFANPSGVAVSSSGRIAVTDTDNDRLQFFAPEGTFLTSWGTGAGSIQGPSRMYRPNGVVFGPNDELYVLDMGRIKQLSAGTP